MPKPTLKPLDDLLETKGSRAETKREQIRQVELSALHSFKNHPFKVLDDEAMEKTVESVKAFGVIVPAIARPRKEGGFELISGHRRRRASELAGLTTMPVIVRDMDDDAATILMVDSNLQREQILPSERAFAYKMRMDAIKRKAGRPSKENASQVGTHLRSDQIMAGEMGESRNQIQRFIRLTELIPQLLDMVDERKIAFNPAVELSYLKPEEQTDFLEAMEYGQATPSLSQAQRLKRLSQDGKCTLEAMCAVMSEEKKSDLDHVTIKQDVLRQYFPKSYTPRQMENTIIKLLDQWQKKRERMQQTSL